MELRKLQSTPDGTSFVTLPKSWVKKAGIVKGNVLSFVEREDGSLLISPYGETERKIEEGTLHPSSLIELEIEEKYLLGYDIIRIDSKEVIEPEMRDKVKETIKRYVGLEIVEEDARKILIQCLLEQTLLIPDRIIRRLHLITLAMQKDAVLAVSQNDSKLARSVVERDEEVDRLYFLLVRLVRSGIRTPSLLEKLSIRPVDCLDYRLLAVFIESFADCAVEVANKALSPPYGKIPEKVATQLEKIGDMIYKMHEDALGSVLARDLKTASKFSTRSLEVKSFIEKAEEILLETPREVVEQLTPVIVALSRMNDLNVDIADLTVTR